MATQQDCAEIERANAQREQRLLELDDEIQDQQNFMNGLYLSDPQRPDVQKAVELLSQHRADLLAEIQQGEVALRDCQQAS